MNDITTELVYASREVLVYQLGQEVIAAVPDASQDNQTRIAEQVKKTASRLQRISKRLELIRFAVEQADLESARRLFNTEIPAD